MNNFQARVRVVRPMDLVQTDAERNDPYMKWLDRTLGLILVSDDESLDAGGHFIGYCSGIYPIRSRYDANPAIADLFLRHELTHMVLFRMSYGKHRNFQDWTRDIIETEVKASLESEFWVYLQIPGLREQTFPFEIWMDRFFPRQPDSPFWLVLWEMWRWMLNSRFGRFCIRLARLWAIHAPRHNDYVENQIANYGRQNIVWCTIWGRKVGYGPYKDKAAWRVVEEHMATLRPGTDGWLERHRNWLDDVSDPETGIPFARQAAAFSAVYKESLLHYGNDVLSS